MLNIVTVQALRKTSSLPTPLKTLLLSLTVSDLGVGLLVQHLYVAIIVMKIKAGTEKQFISCCTDGTHHPELFIFLCFVLW